MESRKFACWQNTLLISFIIFCTEPSISENQPILLIKSESGSCSSGIASKGMLITNAHVVDAVCPESRCDGVRVYRAPEIGKNASEEIPCGSWNIKHLSRALDLGILECKTALIPGSIELPSRVGRASSVSIISYPGCGVLQKTSGEVTSDSGLLLKTSANGDYGSSGGGIFDSDGSLVGIVDQATSARDLLLSKITFQSKFKLRGVKISHVAELLKNTDNLNNQINALKQYYRESIRVEKGVDRLFASFDFLTRVEGLKRDISKLNHPEAASLLATSDYLRASLDSPSKTFSTLVVASILESKGFSWAPWRALSTKSIPSFAAQFPQDSQNEIKEILEVEAADPYSGVELSLIQYVVMLLLVFFLIGIAFGWILAKIHRRKRKALNTN